MLIDFGRAGYLAKARAQPDKVKQVIQKIKTDGLWTTVDAVRAKLDTPIPLGYCNVGTVVEADEHSRFAPGDRVVSNGPHAEMVCIGENLVAKLPGNVNEQTAAYTVLGAIGLQGDSPCRSHPRRAIRCERIRADRVAGRSVAACSWLRGHGN